MPARPHRESAAGRRRRRRDRVPVAAGRVRGHVGRQAPPTHCEPFEFRVLLREGEENLSASRPFRVAQLHRSARETGRAHEVSHHCGVDELHDLCECQEPGCVADGAGGHRCAHALDRRDVGAGKGASAVDTASEAIATDAFDEYLGFRRWFPDCVEPSRAACECDTSDRQRQCLDALLPGDWRCRERPHHARFDLLPPALLQQPRNRSRWDAGVDGLCVGKQTNLASRLTLQRPDLSLHRRLPKVSLGSCCSIAPG